MRGYHDTISKSVGHPKLRKEQLIKKQSFWKDKKTLIAPQQSSLPLYFQLKSWGGGHQECLMSPSSIPYCHCPVPRFVPRWRSGPSHLFLQILKDLRLLWMISLLPVKLLFYRLYNMLVDKINFNDDGLYPVRGVVSDKCVTWSSVKTRGDTGGVNV